MFFCSSSEDELNWELNSLQASLGPNVPIFESPSHGYSVHEVLRIITEDVPKHKMCTEKPCGVRACASFVIDLSRVNLKDLAADDNGVWVTSSPRRMYELCRKQGKIESLQHISRISHDVDKSNVVIVYRQYGKHQATPEFRRIITSVTDYNGATVPKAIVQYFFNGGKKVPVNIQPHGNSKSEFLKLLVALLSASLYQKSLVIRLKYIMLVKIPIQKRVRMKYSIFWSY